MILYYDEKDKISLSESQLKGFFVGWKQSLTPEEHLKVLQGSTHFVIAVNDETNQVIGFVNALSDGINSSFIPLLEVLPEYRGKGIGTKLMEKILLKLENIPNVDLTCGVEHQPFYERFKMIRSCGMIMRKYLNK